MKFFVWSRIRKATGSYHPEGGLVVFAESEDRARFLANYVEDCELQPSEQPDDVRDVAGGREAVYIMPDAGCC